MQPFWLNGETIGKTIGLTCWKLRSGNGQAGFFGGVFQGSGWKKVMDNQELSVVFNSR